MTKFTTMEAVEFAAQGASMGAEAAAAELVARNERGEITADEARAQLLRAGASGGTAGGPTAEDIRACDPAAIYASRAQTVRAARLVLN